MNDYQEAKLVLKQNYSVIREGRQASLDTYFDDLDEFSCLQKGEAIRTRKDLATDGSSRAYSFKRNRMSYKTYKKQGKKKLYSDFSKVKKIRV